MKSLIILTLSMLIAAPAVADISYDYVDVAYNWTGLDVPAPLDGQGDGPLVEASYQFWGPLFVAGGYQVTDFSDDGVEFSDVMFGVGAARQLGKDASGFVRVSFVQTEVDVAGLNFTDDGYVASLGYRAENHTPWEFLGTLDYVNVENGVALGAGMALEYDLTRQLAMIGGVRYFDRSTSGFVGLRWYFQGRYSER